MPPAAAGEARLAAAAAQALDDLAAALAAPAPDPAAACAWSRDTALAAGPAGLALFFHYLDRARPGRGHAARALAHLNQAVAAAAAGVAPPGFFGGLAGTAWAVEHLAGRLFPAPADDASDPALDVGRLLAGHLGHRPWNGDYDLVGGLVGYGVWAVERLPRPAGREAVDRVVARLGELAERRPDGITWLTPPEHLPATDAARHPRGAYNLGVAHGVPGVIGLLGTLRARGLDVPGAAQLLSGAVAWLLRQRLPPGAASRLPYCVAPGAEPQPARLAWCYGDLGVALVLLVAARATGEKDWERQALDLAGAAAGRLRHLAGVVDGGLCHGAAGLAHLYNRLHQATGEPRFRRECLAWIEHLLALRRPECGIAGWQAWRATHRGDTAPAAGGWGTDAGFLTGGAGIGLALLAALSVEEPAWDGALLCSVPPLAAPWGSSPAG